MNSLELSHIAELSSGVAQLIKNELVYGGHVQAMGNQVLLSISKFDMEHRLGDLLQQIYRAVDQQFPVRKEDLSLIVRDADGLSENCFKIWRSE